MGGSKPRPRAKATAADGSSAVASPTGRPVLGALPAAPPRRAADPTTSVGREHVDLERARTWGLSWVEPISSAVPTGSGLSYAASRWRTRPGTGCPHRSGRGGRRCPGTGLERSARCLPPARRPEGAECCVVIDVEFRDLRYTDLPTRPPPGPARPFGGMLRVHGDPTTARVLPEGSGPAPWPSWRIRTTWSSARPPPWPAGPGRARRSCTGPLLPARRASTERARGVPTRPRGRGDRVGPDRRRPDRRVPAPARRGPGVRRAVVREILRHGAQAPARDRDHRLLGGEVGAAACSTRPTTSPPGRAVLDAVRDAATAGS